MNSIEIFQHFPKIKRISLKSLNIYKKILWYFLLKTFSLLRPWLQYSVIGIRYFDFIFAKPNFLHSILIHVMIWNLDVTDILQTSDPQSVYYSYLYLNPFGFLTFIENKYKTDLCFGLVYWSEEAVPLSWFVTINFHLEK